MIPFQFERERLADLAATLQPVFAGADPFPHVQFDGLVPDDVLDAVIAEFPAAGDERWARFHRPREVKLALNDVTRMGPTTRNLIHELNSHVFADFLEEVTGISGLLPDPHLFGGGLHHIERGGLLQVHADFNLHPRLHVDRRLNFLLYLNRDWRETYAGHLELWDRTMSECVRSIPPAFGTCVLFATTDTSFHGHPEPLACPGDMSRKSIAMYYYSNGRPPGEQSGRHSTMFRSRPADRRAERMLRAKDFGKRWVPPIVVDAGRTVRGRLAERG